MSMDPLSFALGGASLVSGVFGAKQQREDAIASAREQMAFQERMSNSAWQRGMADMKAAGLNPILAYQKGPASSPTGAMPAAYDVVSPAVSSAQAGIRLGAEVKNMVETNKNLQETNKNLQEERLRIGAQTSNITADTKIKNEIYQSAMREAQKAKTDQEFYQSPIGRVMRMIGTGASEVGRVFGGQAPLKINVP